MAVRHPIRAIRRWCKARRRPALVRFVRKVREVARVVVAAGVAVPEMAVTLTRAAPALSRVEPAWNRAAPEIRAYAQISLQPS